VTDEPRIFMHHVRAARLCASGARAWANAHGFDWNEFLTRGIPVSRVEGLDPVADRVVRAARENAQ
jgi:hypothetical protein